MKHTHLVLFFLFFGMISGLAQNKPGLVKDTKTGKDIWVGKMGLKQFRLEPFREWFTQESQSYQVDTAALAGITKAELKGLRVLVVLGTWCGDSRRELPRFLKVMKAAGYSKKIEMLGVDRTKTAPGYELSSYDIQRVPTFIFFRKGKEIGRIIESPKESLEKDLAGIVISRP